MKAYEIMTDIIGAGFIAARGENTVDNLKIGDRDREIKKIATCLTITPDLISEMTDWGAELVITHEPTFYNHVDEFHSTPLSEQKKAALLSAGFTVYRYHDSMHDREDDEVNLSMIEKMGWKGEFDGDQHIVLKEAQTARELAAALSEKLNVKHPRIIGAADLKSTKIKLATGQRGSWCYEQFLSGEDEICISGELCEWADGEPVRDAAQFGWNKSIVILGHAGSEKFAMETLAEHINGKYDGAEAKYFDCGEIYTY